MQKGNSYIVSPVGASRTGVANPSQQGLHFLVASITGTGLQDLALESPLNTVIGTSKILPIKLNFQILVLMYQMKFFWVPL